MYRKRQSTSSCLSISCTRAHTRRTALCAAGLCRLRPDWWGHVPVYKWESSVRTHTNTHTHDQSLYTQVLCSQAFDCFVIVYLSACSNQYDLISFRWTQKAILGSKLRIDDSFTHHLLSFSWNEFFNICPSLLHTSWIWWWVNNKLYYKSISEMFDVTNLINNIQRLVTFSVSRTLFPSRNLSCILTSWNLNIKIRD